MRLISSLILVFIAGLGGRCQDASGPEPVSSTTPIPTPPTAVTEKPDPKLSFDEYFTNGLPVQVQFENEPSNKHILTVISGTATNVQTNKTWKLAVDPTAKLAQEPEWSYKAELSKENVVRWTAVAKVQVNKDGAKSGVTFKVTANEGTANAVTASTTNPVADVWFCIGGPATVSSPGKLKTGETNKWLYVRQKHDQEWRGKPSKFVQDLKEELRENLPIVIFATSTGWDTMDKMAGTNSYYQSLLSFPYATTNNTPIGCRGLVIWHGEADASIGARVSKLFYPENEDMYDLKTNTVYNLRGHYGTELYGLIKAWQDRYNNKLPVDQLQRDMDIRSKKVILVQLPGYDRAPELFEHWLAGSNTAFPNVLIRSGYAAVRFAQQDVARCFDSQYFMGYTDATNAASNIELYPFREKTPLIPRVALVPAKTGRNQQAQTAGWVASAAKKMTDNLPIEIGSKGPILENLKEEYLLAPRFGGVDSNLWSEVASAEILVTVAESPGTHKTQKLSEVIGNWTNPKWREDHAKGTGPVIMLGGRDGLPEMPVARHGIPLPAFHIPTGYMPVTISSNPANKAGASTTSEVKTP